MPFEERTSSWALTQFDALESQSHAKVRVFVAAGATVVTIGMWIVHLVFPEIFSFFMELDSRAKFFLAILLAPPFVMAFTIGSFIYPQAAEPPNEDRTGPMSTYFYQERASRRWKLLIASGLFAAVNFVLMLIASGIQAD